MPSASTLLVTPEDVLSAWIASIPGFTPDVVAPVLPADVTTWQNHGAVTMFVVGGTEHPYIPLAKTVLQVETWTCNPGSNEPKWRESRNMASQVRLACLDRTGMKRALQVTVNGVVYPAGSVESVYFLSTPRRAYGDRADYAGYLFDVAMTWFQEGLTIR